MEHPKRKHILTVNLEDYFQTASLGSVVLLKHWDRLERRVESNTLATMALLEEFNLKATFFVSGWIADRLPQLIHEIAKRGHEIASRGYYQRSLARMSPEEFRKDAVRSRIALERACEHAVVGYRVARGWFSLRDLWALDILAEEGFAYDSSLRPLGAGWAGKSDQRRVFKHPSAAGDIWEFPISSWQFAGFCLPISGGNYVRQLPHDWIRRRIENWDKTSPAPLIFYFHVWELDPALPQISAASRLSKIRQYRNLDLMTHRLRHYLGSFRYQAITDYLEEGPRSNEVDSRLAKRRALGPKNRSESLGSVSSMIPEAQASSEAAAEGETPPPAGNATPISIVVPCYNEADTLRYLANTLQSFEGRHRGSYRLHFIFVDDGSTDDTLATLREIFGHWPDCRIVSHGINRGVAAATLTGIANARTEKVCVIDCDCSYDPEILARMIPMLRDDIDLVTASPYHKDGQVINVPGWRLFLSRGLSLLYRQVLNNKLATYTACVRVYRRSSLAGIEIQNEGYFGIAEILQRMDRRGARIVECPAILEARLLGVSKMKIIKTIGGHCKLLFASLVYRLRPKRKPKADEKTHRAQRDGVKEDERVGC